MADFAEIRTADLIHDLSDYLDHWTTVADKWGILTNQINMTEWIWPKIDSDEHDPKKIIYYDNDQPYFM